MAGKLLNIILTISLFIGHLVINGQNISGAYEINKQIFYGNMLVEANQFYPELLKIIVLEKVNIQRINRGYEPYMEIRLFDSIAQNQSKYMRKYDMVTTGQKGKLKTTEKRALYYGASNKIVENVFRFSLSYRAGSDLTYENLADDIVFKWYNSIKIARLLDNPKFNYCGFGFSPDKAGKKLYASFILGNYRSFNEGANKIDSLSIVFSNKKYGLKEYDSKACRKCNTFKAIEDLQNGLNVENDIIYFESQNLKQFKKLIKNNKDAISVDIVLKEQFPCNEPNIVDNNLFNKGILLKKVNANTIYKNNLITDRKKNSLKIEAGELPAGLNTEYELNLVLIRNKHVCKNINQSFIITDDADYIFPVSLLADTITLYSEDVYVPEADTTFLSFKIPFEKKKYNYKTSDIEPFLKLLNEPEFIINELTIYAYTSLEGTDEENVLLQKQRAESIVKALEERQKDEIITQIITDYNWTEFQQDILGTKHNILASMSMEKAQAYIRKYALQDELEPILKNHRYAKIDMKVTYDISDDLEEKFVLRKFNDAILTKDLPLALSIQKFIFKKVFRGKYSADAVYGQTIPMSKDFAGLRMNQLWLRKYIEKENLQKYASEINKLNELDPDNNYILFNHLYCELKLGQLKDDKKVNMIQNQIDKLYFASFSKAVIDALNMEFQFKVIDSLSLFSDPQKMFEKRLGKMKYIYEINERSENKALKIANYFIRNNDYEYATQILEPFADNNLVSEGLILTYLSLCSHSAYRTNTNNFIKALKTAKYINHERFCELFEGDKFSFQIFENPKVKEFVCKTCPEVF